jgi:hypothetical protein
LKSITLWGAVAPSHNKPRGGGICGRPGCNEPKHVTPGGTVRGYCRAHTAEWSRLKKQQLERLRLLMHEAV